MSSAAEEVGNLLKFIPWETPTIFADNKKESKLNDKFTPPGLGKSIVPTSSINLFWTTGPKQQESTNFVTSTYPLPDIGLPPIRRKGGNTSEGVLAPVDIRKLLGNNRRFCVGSGGTISGTNLKVSKNKKPKDAKQKSLSGLSPKLIQLGVSKRLIKLENLNSKPERELTVTEKNEKTNLLRLESKRNAAIVCRERKKKYIQSLEERSLKIAKHVEALEKQNEELRALLSRGCRGVALPPPLPPFKPAPLAKKPRCYQRRIERSKKRNVLSSMEKLYLSTLYLDSLETIDLPPMCAASGRKSKRLRLA